MTRERTFGRNRLSILAAFLCLAALISILFADSGDPCCFTNDRYEGVCTVMPGKGETCQSIQDYLNNPMSNGKAYCGSTAIRGGWKNIDCSKGKKP